MSEYLKFKGRLAVLEKEKLELELRLSSLRDAIRSNLDPFEPVGDIKGKHVASDGMELATKQIIYLSVIDKIEAVKKALGQ